MKTAVLNVSALFAFGLMTIGAEAAKLNAPKWDVWVVDEAGKPVANIAVLEVYRDYTCEDGDHTETLMTDSDGHVVFPARELHANPIGCAKNTASNLAAGVHASLGRHAYIAVGKVCDGCLYGFPVDKRGKVEDWNGSPKEMVSHITVRRFERYPRAEASH